MNKKIIFSILIIVSLISILPIYGQNSTSNNSNISSGTQLTQENVFNAAQNDIDRSIDILNMVSTAITILVAFIGILVAIGAAVGIFEYKTYRNIRKESERDMEEIKKYAEQIKPIYKRIKNAEKEINEIREKTKPLPTIDAPPLKEGKVEENLIKNIEFLESIGSPLQARDYNATASELYNKEEDYESALHWINKGIKVDNKDSLLFYNKAIILFKLGKTKEAFESSERSLKLNPDYVPAWYNHGIYLKELKKCDEAIEAYNEAIKRDPNSASAWYNRACLYSLKNNKEKALNDLTVAIELDSKYKEFVKKDKDFKKFKNDDKFKNLIK